MITWQQFLAQEQAKPYFQRIINTVAQQRADGEIIYPSEHEVMTAFEQTSFSKIKVVILGQDPYHGPGQAHGLAFSVKPNVKIPPSLRNIYKELQDDISDFHIPAHGFLQSWAQQGVLLLNTVLTVKAGQAHSHAKIGWEQFTDAVIDLINQESEGVVFMLLGSHAHKKGCSIDGNKHCVLKAVHPSPLSAHRGFFGCQHFSKANEWLSQHGKPMINWQVKEMKQESFGF